jgi:hypothetical protein
VVRGRETPLLGGPRPPKPVTLPPFELADIDIEREAKEAAQRVCERKIVRIGRDAYHEITRAESFEAWCRVGAALAFGKAYALKATGANAAWGRRYSLAFSVWMKETGFGFMRPSDRSNAVELHENLKAITAWRATLPERERRRLIGAQANVKRWRKETQQTLGNGKCPTDLRRDAIAAWRRFVSCVELLPPDQAAPLWQAVHAQAAATLAHG